MKKNMQRGSFAIGVVVGLLSGLVLALGVALYIAKVPIPFVNKVPGRTAEQDNAEAERNRSWDPNAPLNGRPAARASVPGAPGAVVGGSVVVPPPATAPVLPPPAGAAVPGAPASPRDPAAILSGAPVPGASAPAPRSTALGGEPFVFVVQAGAYTRSDDAEQQRAKLALMGQQANISEREQAGRMVYRVRVGPFRTRDEADALLVKLQAASVEAQIVRVERP
ncbi:MAG: SPOR domain-containing protein [Burkholderiaceae bacterium]|nr:SPOR domain-containing protein [Burkholderiaceae bacterium]